jgi:hypothetical protein
LSLGISLALLDAQDNENLLVVALIDHFHNIISLNLVLSALEQHIDKNEFIVRPWSLNLNVLFVMDFSIFSHIFTM